MYPEFNTDLVEWNIVESFLENIIILLKAKKNNTNTSAQIAEITKAVISNIIHRIEFYNRLEFRSEHMKKSASDNYDADSTSDAETETTTVQ